MKFQFLGYEKNYLAGVHVDEVGSFLSHCESVESIFGINEVIFPALLDPENICVHIIAKKQSKIR